MKKERIPRFDAGDFLAQEAYLSQQHSLGKAAANVGFGNKVAFADTAPADYSYRLEFMPKGMPMAEYSALVVEYGWELVGKLNGWMCLRRPSSDPAEPDGTLIHNDLERGKWGRERAEKETLIGVAPMVICYLASCALKNTALAAPLWQLGTLFVIIAVAVAFTAYRVRAKCGIVMTEYKKRQKALAEAFHEPPTS